MAIATRKKPIGAQMAFRPIAGLIPYAKNARLHSEAQIAAIATSMREWGWTMPVLVAEGCPGVADGEIIAGHGRILAASSIYAAGEVLRMASGDPLPSGTVPVVVARGWTESQRRAYVIADNQLTLSGEWDPNLLRTEMLDLRGMGFDLTKLGFDDEGLAGVLGRMTGLVDPDDAPPVPAVPVTRLGDVWTLGRHRLVCGDATDEAVVAKALDGAQPRLMVTDPPYGVDYDAAWRVDRGLNRTGSTGVVTNDDRVDWREAFAHFTGDVAYVWHSSWHIPEVQAALEACRFQVRTQIIWVKHAMVIGRGDYHWQHEPCLYAVRKGKTGHWNGDRTQSSVWFIDKPQRSETGHSTQKPVECMRRPIENNSRPGHAVYEPFVGSGTTIIACEMTGRDCRAIEIAPGYCDVVVERWQTFTGGKASRGRARPARRVRLPGDSASARL